MGYGSKYINWIKWCISTTRFSVLVNGSPLDDTLILCDASKEDLEYMSWIFTWFEAISGLKINLEKSELILVEDVSNLEELAEILGCELHDWELEEKDVFLERLYDHCIKAGSKYTMLEFFAWEATQARILTLKQLKRKDWRISNRCCMCKEDE
ncbi:hypothetical protein CK203_024418 [Vitis vinifera]|uniref:Reverse transcriptase zinc-binding domain-containing protein n=1 Tax=Vitis vinifera TaxID=29760 RepID=A0A438IY83_VITVI|nr:hypothetical protein CK203_024418 [Vitis vinifera]